MNVVSTINQISGILLVIFNLGIIARIAYIFLDSILSEEPYGVKIRTHVKAAIVINSISGVVLVIMNYYP